MRVYAKVHAHTGQFPTYLLDTRTPQKVASVRSCDHRVHTLGNVAACRVGFHLHHTAPVDQRRLRENEVTSTAAIVHPVCRVVGVLLDKSADKIRRARSLLNPTIADSTKEQPLVHGRNLPECTQMSQRNAERIGTVAARDFAALHRVTFSRSARNQDAELTALGAVESAANGCSSTEEGATLLGREFAGTCGGACHSAALSAKPPR